MFSWSAERATFASVSLEARYALQADHLICSEDTDTSEYPPLCDTQFRRVKSHLHALEKEFTRREHALESVPGQDADEATFAGCADFAEFAREAESAHYVLGLED